MIRRAEFSAAHAEMEEYEDDVTELLTEHGVAGLIARAARRHEVVRDFRVQDPAGRLLAGDLPPPPGLAPGPQRFWAVYPVARGGESPGGRVLAFVRPEPGGLKLVVGEYLRVREQKDDSLLIGSVGLAGVVAVLGLAGGVLVGQRTQRRVDQIAQTVARYADGARSERIPLGPAAGSDHDRLARAINDMMDRENRLIEGLRQVSSAIAHDLRRPLAHHNQEIAAALAGPRSVVAYREALSAASARVSEVLQTFQSLLHIAELEAGAPGLKLEPVEVNPIVARVVEAYLPAAEEGGRRLMHEARGGPLVIPADPHVLGRTIANLVENALAHTPAGTRVLVLVDGARRSIVVEDDGPGVPEPAREKIFQRFFRLDVSRSTPGNGLGLALALAAIQAFGGVLRAEDAGPGLRIVADFTGAAQA
jgi:signal transduction histidine kinase